MKDTFVVDELLLEDADGTGSSGIVNVRDCSVLTFHIVSADTSTGATVEIQSSLDGENWATINDSAKSISTDGTTEFNVSGAKYKLTRANITSYTDGTYSVRMVGGN